MSRIQNYYLAGFTLSSAILNMFFEGESAGIKVLCLILLFGTFVFAFLFHNLKNKVAEGTNKPRD